MQTTPSLARSKLGQALVDASGLGGGDVQLQGGRLVVSEGAQIRSFTLGDQPGGTVEVRALRVC